MRSKRSPANRKPQEPHARSKRLTNPKMSGVEVDLLKLFVKTSLHSREPQTLKSSFGIVYVDFTRHELLRNGIAIRANAREFRLLRYFLEHEGEVVSREQLLRDVWKYDSPPNTRSVDNYILSLRKKIETDPSLPKHLFTLRGAGYKFTR